MRSATSMAKTSCTAHLFATSPFKQHAWLYRVCSLFADASRPGACWFVAPGLIPPCARVAATWCLQRHCYGQGLFLQQFTHNLTPDCRDSVFVALGSPLILQAGTVRKQPLLIYSWPVESTTLLSDVAAMIHAFGPSRLSPCNPLNPRKKSRTFKELQNAVEHSRPALLSLFWVPVKDQSHSRLQPRASPSPPCGWPALPEGGCFSLRNNDLLGQLSSSGTASLNNQLPVCRRRGVLTVTCLEVCGDQAFQWRPRKTPMPLLKPWSLCSEEQD